MREKALVLDTCALLWLAAGSKDLSPQALRAIETASVVYVSTISAWEISLKVARGNLRLPLEPGEWFKRSVSQHKLIAAPLDIDIPAGANQLPWHHRDPADRFIVATALREAAPVVTRDQRFVSYGVQVLT